MIRNSAILIITIGTNNKRQGGFSYQRKTVSIPSLLPEHAPEIFRRRQIILDFLKGDSVKRDGISLSNMQLNSKLKKGPDFGGDESSLYMPVYQRYIGRFYTEVSVGNPNILLETSHHILILSGLYGLLLPEELIQAHSCHVKDHPKIPDTWCRDSFLTSLILAYIKCNSIKKIFDLTGQEAYRCMVDWSRIARKAEVLHVFSEQYSGPSSLPSLGEFARVQLLSAPERELLEISDGSHFFLEEHGRVVLTMNAFPPEGFPRENEKLLIDKKTVEYPKQKAPPGKKNISSKVLSYRRDISVTSGEHNTMFDKKIASIQDIPPLAQEIFWKMSQCSDVLEVFLGKFTSHGPKSESFKIKLHKPQLDSGHIFGKIIGPGKIGRVQYVDVRVTKGREHQALQAITELLAEEDLLIA